MNENIEKLKKLVKISNDANLDIYENWKYAKRLENCEKYPYIDNILEIPEETKTRLYKREETDGVKLSFFYLFIFSSICPQFFYFYHCF